MKTTKNIYGIALALVCSLAATLKAQDIYVSNYEYQNATIGEYTTAGATVNASLITGLSYPEGIAISGNDLFVVNSPSSVGEYTTTGATINASLISGLYEPYGIAISGNDLFVENNLYSIGKYTTTGATVNATLISGLNGPAGIAIGRPS